MFEEFDGEVGATEFARVAKSFEVLFGFCGELRFIIAQEDEAWEKRDVSGRHLLSRKDNATIYAGNLAFLVLIHVHTVTPCAVPQTFQKLPLVYINGVLKLIDMDECIGTLCYSVRQCRQRGVLDVGRRVLNDEEGHERVSEFGLTRAFRTKEIEDGEWLGLGGNDIAEQGRQEKGKTYLCIVPKDGNQKGNIVFQTDISPVSMHEVALELIEWDIFFIDGGECR